MCPNLERDHPVANDFADALARGCRNGGLHLTAGELRIVDRMQRLAPPAMTLFARLVLRKPDYFRVDDLTYDELDDPIHLAQALIVDGLLDTFVPHRARGKKPDGFWVRVRHRKLCERLYRWATVHAFPDPSWGVRTRMGQLQWAEFALTDAPSLHPHRKAALAWERLLSPELTPQAAVRALNNGNCRAPGRMDLTRHLARALTEHVRTLEREGQLADAAVLCEALSTAYPPYAGRVATRWALTLDKLGETGRGVEVLRQAKPTALEPDRVAIDRTGRRLCKRLRTSWGPVGLLRKAATRTVELPIVPEANAPKRWASPSGPVPVEHAVVDALAQQGRTAVHTEGRALATLIALCFADVMFSNVPHQLPSPFLREPLDLQTPPFLERRDDAYRDVLSSLNAGHARQCVENAWTRWEGVQLRGARWRHVDRDTVCQLAEHLPVAVYQPLAFRFLCTPTRAFGGMPDLVVHADGNGDAVLPFAMPRKLPSGLFLVEVKGPGDQLQDNQRTAIHDLLGWGVKVEQWHVTPFDPKVC